MDIYIGFDSAWTDNPKAPGAICAIAFEKSRPVSFVTPRLCRFREAADFIKEFASRDGVTLVAIDQPTKVPNLAGMRPVERVAASVVSWIGGGVQPANRSKIGMFCDDSPVWQFLEELSAIEDPEIACNATSGLFLIEVFPALALASLDDERCRRLGAFKYNPANKKFKLQDWQKVVGIVHEMANDLECSGLSNWCKKTALLDKPTKSDQDKLDSVMCALIAIQWRLRRAESAFIGDLKTGYIVTPTNKAVYERLTAAARRHSVFISPLV